MRLSYSYFKETGDLFAYFYEFFLKGRLEYFNYPCLNSSQTLNFFLLNLLHKLLSDQFGHLRVIMVEFRNKFIIGTIDFIHVSFEPQLHELYFIAELTLKIIGQILMGRLNPYLFLQITTRFANLRHSIDGRIVDGKLGLIKYPTF